MKPMHIASTVLVTLGPLVGAGPAIAGPISLGAGDYLQDFDTLTTSTTAVTWVDDDATAAAAGHSLAGWYYATSEGADKSFSASNGGSNTSRLYSHGSAGDTDRALGGVNNLMSVGTLWFGARFVNDTDDTITSFTVTYDGEQWRDNASDTADDLLVQYRVFAAGAGSISAGGYVTLDDATFWSPTNNVTGVATALDGNDAAHRVADLTATRSITLLPGQELWIRFEDALHVGNDHALDVDHFRLTTAIPEPGSVALLSLAGAAAARRRPRR